MVMGANTERIEELKSLVLHTLETNGVLGEIRAQLRSNVFKAIDAEEESLTKEVTVGPVKLHKSRYGRLMAEIVAEFFEFYEFKHSLSVFAPESNLRKVHRSKAEVALEAGLARALPDASLLEQLIGLATGAELRKATPSPPGWHSSASSTTASSPPPQLSSLVSSRPFSADGISELRHETSSLFQSTEARMGRCDNTEMSDAVPEEAPEEVGRERRKPQVGRLPSLPGSPSASLSGSGKDVLQPRTAPGTGPDRPVASEEVSLADSMGGTSRDSLEEVDRKFQARIDHKIHQLNSCIPGKPELVTPKVGSPRDRSPSQAASLAASPVQSARSVRSGSVSGSSASASPLRSPQGCLSPGSNARSAGSRSNSGDQEAHMEDEPVESAGESVSVEDNDNASATSGSLDLTGEREHLGGAGGSHDRGSSGRQRLPMMTADDMHGEEPSSSGSSIQGALSEVQSDDDKF